MGEYRVQIPLDPDAPDGACTWGTTARFLENAAEDGRVYDGVVAVADIRFASASGEDLRAPVWISGFEYVYAGVCEAVDQVKVFREALVEEVPPDADATSARYFLTHHQPWRLQHDGEPWGHKAFEHIDEREVEAYTKRWQDRLDRLGRVIEWYDRNPEADALPLLFGLVGDVDQSCNWFEALAAMILSRYGHAEVAAVCKDAILKGPVGRALWVADEIVYGLDHGVALALTREVFLGAIREVRSDLLVVLAREGDASDIEMIEYAKRVVADEIEQYSEVLEDIRRRVDAGSG